MREIEIHQVTGQIGLKITPPNMDLKIKGPDIQLKTTPANLDLEITYPEVNVDSREAFNSMGLQDSYSFSASSLAQAQQASSRGLDRRAQVGDQMADPHGPSAGKIVAEASKPPEKELVIGLSPSVRPRISATLGTIRGTYTPAHIKNTVNEGTITNNFTWGKVVIYMEREPSIDIKG